MPRRQANKRMPVSCGNCRERKIACSGRQAPCQTCVRRGYESTCYFQRVQLPPVTQRPQTPQSMSSDEHDSLLHRISTLERLLQDNIQSTREALTRDAYRHAAPTSSSSSPDFPAPQTATHQGRLIFSDTGHVRYVPRYNTMDEMIQDSPDYATSPESTQSTGFPFSFSSGTTKAQILQLFPPFSYCDELKNIFMEVFSPLFHILHDPTFQAQYDTFRQNPHEVSLPLLALILVVLAIAVTALDDDHHLMFDLGWQPKAGTNARSIAKRFRVSAMQALAADNFLCRHNLNTVQALVLLIYASSHANEPSWSLLGATLNIAVAIGCHVDPSKYNVSVIEAEERRRCWAALMMLYTIQDTCMGNLSPMHIQADIRPPTDVDDDALAQLRSPQELDSWASASPSKMAYILHKFQLYRLASEICTLGASSEWTEVLALALDSKIAAEGKIQENRFSHLLALPIYHQAHYYILNNYTHHLFLILHRPYLALTNMSSPPSLKDSESASVTRLCQASLQILNNYVILHETQGFRPYKWYTYGLGSFHALLAATTLASIIPAAALQISTALAIDKIRRCLRIFEQASERSEMCEKASIILRRVYKSPSSAVSDRARHQLQPQSACDNTGLQEASRSARGNSCSDPQVYSSQYEAVNTEWNDSRLNGSIALEVIGDPEGEDIDCSTWLANSQFQNVLSQIPAQQWLSPSSFPWWRCDENSYGTV